MRAGLTQADGPAGVGDRAIALPLEGRAGTGRYRVWPAAPLIPRAADGDEVITALGVELGGGQIARGVYLDRAGLVVAVLACAVGGTAVRIDLAEARARRHLQPCRHCRWLCRTKGCFGLYIIRARLTPKLKSVTGKLVNVKGPLNRYFSTWGVGGFAGYFAGYFAGFEVLGALERGFADPEGFDCLVSARLRRCGAMNGHAIFVYRQGIRLYSLALG